MLLAGLSKENMEAGYYRLVFKYLTDVFNMSVPFSPYRAAEIMNINWVQLF